jgi:uncharacterized membrane protein YdcZ (DUF606 family)
VKPRQTSGSRRPLLRAAAAMAGVALVVVATLPHDWQDHSHWARVNWWPFLTGVVRPRDLFLNVLLFVPLGIALQWRKPHDARRSALVVAALLSASMELTQVWSHDRFPSATDVVMNVAGCILGAHLLLRRRVESDTTARVTSP